MTPTVNCGESAPDFRLPAYPAYVDDVQKWSELQSEWAISAAGVFKKEKLLRQRTKTCLDGLRQEGIIN